MFIRSMDSFQGLTPNIPSSWHRSLAPSPIFFDHVNPITGRTIDQSAGGKLRDLNPEESWAILEDLALYDNESWNDLRDFLKPVKAITLPQDVLSTSGYRLIDGPRDTRHFMENPEQAFVEYASSCTDEAGASQDARLSKFEADFKQRAKRMTNKIDTVLKAITDRISGTLPSDTIKNPKLWTHPVSSTEDDRRSMFIEIIRDDDEPQNEGPNEGEGATTEEPKKSTSTPFQLEMN
ncbi:hypothetical protein Tco_0527773 [Tanacetum coccineum]